MPKGSPQTTGVRLTARISAEAEADRIVAGTVGSTIGHAFTDGRHRNGVLLTDVRSGQAYTAVVEHEAAPTFTLMVEPAGVLKRRIVTDPEPLVLSLQLCPPSEAVASLSGWFEVM
jgi:hypothetical protein